MVRLVVASLSVILATGCCKYFDREEDVPPEPVEGPSAGDESDTDDEVEPAPPEPEVPEVALPPRADAELGGKVKVASGGKLPESRAGEPYALEGGAAVPSWGAAGSDPSLARNDDLLTAWTCSTGGETPCALGIGFPEQATVTSVRLFAAAGPTKKDFVSHARPKQVRVHTDAGWIDATLDDGVARKTIHLPEPVETGHVTVEFVKIRSGREDDVLNVADLEVFGTAGEQRAPLVFAADLTVTRFDDRFWNSGGKTMVSWIEEIDGEGGARRLFKGTELIGRRGARYVLVERLRNDDCDGEFSYRHGYYVLVDRETRQMYDLRMKDAQMSFVYIHPERDEFAMKTENEFEDESVFGHLVIEEDSYSWNVRKLVLGFDAGYGDEEPDTADSRLDEAGFEREWWDERSVDPSCPTGLSCPEGPGVACKEIADMPAIGLLKTLKDEEMAELREAVDCCRNDHYYDIHWQVCTYGDVQILYSAGHCYSDVNVLAVIDPTGNVEAYELGSGFDVVEWPGGTALVQWNSTAETTSDIFVVSADGTLDPLYPHARFRSGVPPFCHYCVE